MVKIKELTNFELNEYLEAYEEILGYNPDDDQVRFKVEAIKKALADRKLLGYEGPQKQEKTQKKKGLLSFFKRK